MVSFNRCSPSRGKTEEEPGPPAEFDSETSLYFYRARYYDQNTGRFISEDPARFFASMSFYPYVRGNPANSADPMGLHDFSDFLRALRHYCDGSGTDWTWNFDSVNWGNLQNNEIAKVKSMVGTSCTDRTVPVNLTMPAQAEGWDRIIIGGHSIRLQGMIEVHCDCSWNFIGDMSSAEGYDTYRFYPSNRGFVGETETWIGGHICKGKPFRIFLPGATSGSMAGKIEGKPTCPCQK